MNLILIPLMTAILGWLVAWLFVKLIFSNWNGGLTNMIESIKVENFITAESSLNQFDLVLPFIDAQLEDFFKNKLGEKMPMIAMFVGDKTVAQLKAVFIEELKVLFPNLIQQFAANAKHDFAKNLQLKWKPILEPALLKATRKYRIGAFAIGLVWGILILMLSYLL